MKTHKFYVEIETNQNLEWTGTILTEKLMKVRGWHDVTIKSKWKGDIR